MIRFPKMHIATSVVNRILNVRDDVDAHAAAKVPRDPAVPDPALEGAAIDAKLGAPAPDVGDASDPAAAAALEASLKGEKPIDGVLEGIAP